MMMKSRITFNLGGIKSGKSSYAVEQAKILSKKYNSSVTYLATCVPKDREMKGKVYRHKKSRPYNWKTIEEPVEIKNALEKIKTKILIVDCLNIWVGNVLQKKWTEDEISEYIRDFCLVLRDKNILSFIVSNEVGLTLVSPNKIARLFQNVLGKVNQVVAENSDKVYFLVAGIPVKVK